MKMHYILLNRMLSVGQPAHIIGFIGIAFLLNVLGATAISCASESSKRELAPQEKAGSKGPEASEETPSKKTEGPSVDGWKLKHLYTATIDGDVLYQTQLLPDRKREKSPQVIGIGARHHRIRGLEPLQGQDPWAALNSRGDVIALYQQDNHLWALVISNDAHKPVVIMQAPFNDPSNVKSWSLPAPQKLPCSSGKKVWEETRTLSFSFNKQAPDFVKILPVKQDRVLISMWYGILPLVWEVDLLSNGPHDQYEYLLPFPQPDDESIETPFSAADLSSVTTENEIWLSMLPDEFVPYLAPTLPFEVSRSSAYLLHFQGKGKLKWEKALRSSAVAPSLTYSEAFGPIALWWNEGRFLAEAPFSCLFCEADPGDWEGKTSIYSVYAEAEGKDTIWLNGSTSIQQAKTGSIIGSSKAFLLAWDLRTCRTRSSIWKSPRFTFADSLMDFEGDLYFLNHENAPLTHDTDRRSVVSLVSVAGFSE